MNQELNLLFESDQLERQDAIDHGTSAFLALQDRDRERRRRAEIIIATTGLQTPQDYYHAAMIFMHGESGDDAWRAYMFASHAANDSYRPARWLSAAAYDRWLVYQGKPQKFGTQIVLDGRRFRLCDVDPATKDAERAEWDVPPLEEMRRRAEVLSRTKTKPSLDEGSKRLIETDKQRWDSLSREESYSSRTADGTKSPGSLPLECGKPQPFALLFAEDVPAQHLRPPPGYDITQGLARLLGRGGATGRRDTVLIISSSADLHVDAVALEVARRGAPVRRLVWPQCRLSLRIGGGLKKGGISQLALPSDDVALEEVKSVWLRSADLLFERPAEGAGDVDEFMRRETDAVFRGLCSGLDTALWVSHPNAIQAANNKMDQLRLAESMDLAVPKTLVTNDPKQAREFFDECNGNMVLKTFTGWLGPVSRRPRAVYTSRILPEHLEQLDRVSQLPCLFQEYVPKDVEVRVTIIGKRVFAAEIHSQLSPISKDDWRRYDLANTPYTAAQLPAAVEDACLRILEHYGLAFGAIDMIRRPDGTYVFLELNPNGQWLWIQELTRLPLVEAMVDLLVVGASQ